MVDLHNHAVLKRFLLDRDLTTTKTKFLASLFKRAFWPLSQRSTFPLIDKGGIDVVLSTCYIPEREWLEDQSLVKWALALSPEVRKRIKDEEDKRAVCVAKSGQELQQILGDGDIALIHSVEGGHSLQGLECETSTNMRAKEDEILQNLEHLSERGVAYLTLAHFYPNLLAHPVFPYPNYGIKRKPLQFPVL